MTRLTPIDTPYAYKLSELVLRVSECVEAVSEWCRSVSIDTSVGGVDCVQVSIDTGVKVSSQGSSGGVLPVFWRDMCGCFPCVCEEGAQASATCVYSLTLRSVDYVMCACIYSLIHAPHLE